MTKEELKQYLTENLKLEIKQEGPCYGMSGTTTLKLMLEGEEIDEIYWDNNDANKEYV